MLKKPFDTGTPTNMRRTFSTLALLLLCACASETTKYQIGETGALQDRAEAENTAARSTARVIGENELDRPVKILSSPFPDYPPWLRNDRYVGLVRLEFVVQPDGSVANATVVGSPSPELAAISLHAIMRWRFEPPMRGGVPVAVRVRQEFDFRLR
jgi:TonB family protein